jgi:hypothetical protein
MDRRYNKRIARYWARRERACLTALASRDMHGWFNYWHLHPDTDGKGDRCEETRKSAMQLAYRLLQETEARCRGSRCENSVLGVHRCQCVQRPCIFAFRESRRDATVRF